MKTSTLILALAAASPSVFAAPMRVAEEPRTPASAPAPAPAPAPAGAHPVGSLRIVTPDGNTVLAQAPLSLGTSALSTLTIDAKQAFLFANGRCAFNVKYDERSDIAKFGTTNQIYDNDVLVAQNSSIDLAAGITRTVWTQPYLQPGTNNLRLVIDSAGAAPVRAWVRVQVNGTCAAAAPAPTPEPPHAASGPASSPTGGDTHTTVTYGPGTAQWQALYNAWGYSNYGRKQLDGKGYAKYAALVALNNDLTTVVKAGKVTADAWNSLMARWKAISTDPAFIALMKSITPTGDGNTGGTGTGTGTGTGSGSGSGSTGTPTPPAPQTYGPGTSQWQALYNAWGYSNYARKQLDGKGFSKYATVVSINTDLTAAVNAGKVTVDAWNGLMTRWSALANDPDFQAAMKAIVPTGDGH